jgi:hypothetical protein
MKKSFKIVAAIVLFIIALVIILPLVFEDKIIDLVKQTANNNMNATLDFEGADLSIFSGFPSAGVSLEKVSIINQAPFEGDTLFSAKTIDLKMPLLDLFKSGSNISITNFTVDGASVVIKINKEGNANYDIAKETTSTSENTSESSAVQLELDSYEITNSIISYDDESSKMLLKLTDFNHSGNGNLSSEKSELKTQTTTEASFEFDSVAYLNKNKLQLDAIVGIDLKESTYSFLENKLLINQLPLIFDGFVKLNEKNQEVKLSFKTPSSDFKNFLALIPEVYSKNIEGVTTTGNFDVQGIVEGIIDDTHIPKFNILINSDNASFKYPDLPKSLTNININTKITNETGSTKDTYVAITKLNFKVDNEVFNAKAELREVTENMKVTASLNGIVNLASLEQIYPAEGLKGLKGILDADATTNFDMASIENSNYENTKTAGSFKLSNFEYVSEEFSNPLKIAKAGITFTPKTVNLTSFDAQLGQTDFAASGTINNLLGFLFNKENVAGNFNLTSNTFAVNDFMVSEIEETEENTTDEKETAQERIKIPSFLDCTINAKATTVLYDNITLKNVSATMLIKDEKVALKNVKSNVFGGDLGFNGSVSTKENISTFQLDIDASKFDISQSFKQLELFQALAPIANAISGKIDAKIKVSGNLNNDMTPDLNSLSGNMLTELLSSKITMEKSPLLQNLDQKLTFLDIKKLNLENLKTALTFKDGKVALDPFTINYEDIEIEIAGGHGFDKSLTYDAVLNVPAKYLGKEASQLIAQLNDEETKNIKVPVSTLISGKFTRPTIKTDLKAAITNLTKQVANNQKEKLINQGKDKVTDVLSNLLGGKKKDSTKVDSLKKDPTKEAAKDLLDGLFKRKKKKKDTVN